MLGRMAKQVSSSLSVDGYRAGDDAWPLAAFALVPVFRWRGLYKPWEAAATNGVQVNVQAPLAQWSRTG